MYAVAVLAYAVSTGAPDLQLSVKFPFSVTNAPAFLARREDGQLRAASTQLDASIYLRNENQYPARSPAVVVRLRAMAFDPKGLPPGWAVTGFENTVGATEVQWDGGASYSVHGYSRRRLPDLHLSGLTTLSQSPPCFEFEILADGYRRTVVLEAGFMVADKVISPGASGSAEEGI